MKSRLKYQGLILVGLALPLWAAPPKPPKQVLFFNGNILPTFDSPQSVVHQLLVAHGKVVSVGNDLKVPKNTLKKDLKGLWVIPAFADSHAHLLETGEEGLGLNLKNKSLLEIKNLIQKELKKSPRPFFITGFGWDQTRWPGSQFPSRYFLDELAQDIPIILFRIDGHAAWANTLALSKAKLLESLKKDESVVVDLGLEKLQALLPPLSKSDIEKRIRRTLEKALALGITSIHDPGISLREYDVLKNLIQRENLSFRFYEMASSQSQNDLDFFLKRGPEVELLEGRLTLRTVKLYLDGALGSRGALLETPYSDNLSQSGIQLLEESQLEALIRKIDEHGFQVAIHAIGPKANRLALSALQKVLGTKIREARPRIEHAQVLDKNSISQMGKLGVVVAMQPIHCTSDSRWVLERLGKDRARFSYPWKSLLEAHTPVAFGSDSPIESLNPWKGLFAATTRKLSPKAETAFFPEEKISLQEALLAYSKGAAFAAFQEAQLGELTPGKWADFQVLRRNPFDLKPHEIFDETPQETYFGGKLVYQKKPR